MDEHHKEKEVVRRPSWANVAERTCVTDFEQKLKSLCICLVPPGPTTSHKGVLTIRPYPKREGTFVLEWFRRDSIHKTGRVRSVRPETLRLAFDLDARNEENSFSKAVNADSGEQGVYFRIGSYVMILNEDQPRNPLGFPIRITPEIKEKILCILR